VPIRCPGESGYATTVIVLPLKNEDCMVLENTSIMLSIGILSYHVCTIMSQVAVNKFIAIGMITNSVIVMGTGGPYIHIHRFGVGVPIAII